MKLKEIYYTNQDLINLVKNNTAAIVECEPRELYVELKNKDGRTSARVFRVNGKDINL